MIDAVNPTEDPKIDPCRHMRTWVSALADGSLGGFARWYTHIHASHCPRCHKALVALISLRESLRKLAGLASGKPATLPEARIQALKSEFDRIDTNG